ncbi:hypothetical protein cypCar_00018566, partial [Cyprinus carpio]
LQSPDKPDELRPSPSPLPQGLNELESYQSALEEVLTWLLSAEDGLQAQPPISSLVEEVKEQFHTHERQQTKEIAYRGYHGADFNVSSRAVLGRSSSKKCVVVWSAAELMMKREVREPDDLLTYSLGTSACGQYGETEQVVTCLHDKPLARNINLLHEVLMDLQHQQLKQLSDWLDTTETRIKRMGAQPLGPELDDIKRQIEEQKLLQEDLELEQVRVNSLTHMVVVVDENSGNGATAALEEKLQNLGERWAAICKWTEERWILLQKILLCWQHFSEEQ